MQTNITPASSFAEVDPIANTYVVRAPDGENYTLIQEGCRLSIKNNKTEIGAIVHGSSWSGSLWAGDECLGEYVRIDGRYTVTPYEKWHKTAQSQDIHPLDYLLTHICIASERK